MSVGYLIGASDENVIEIFARINSVSKTLNPQEKRNAQFSGAFKQFSVAEAVERLPFWRNNRIFTDAQIARMLEVQYISDLAINLDEGLQDFSSATLNHYYRKYETSFEKDTALKRRISRLFDILVALPDGLLKSTVFSTPQILFSLMIVVDRHPVANTDQIAECINELESRVEATKSGEQPQALDTDLFGAFTSGNLHRIRARQLRDSAIAEFFR